jgi:hypothetical protein
MKYIYVCFKFPIQFLTPHVSQEQFGSKRNYERSIRRQFRKRGGVKAKSAYAATGNAWPIKSKPMPVPPKAKQIPPKAMPVSQTVTHDPALC